MWFDVSHFVWTVNFMNDNFHDFQWKTMLDFRWNHWNFGKQDWTGFCNLELKLNLVSWNATNCFRVRIFRERKFTDPSLVKALFNINTVALRSLYLQKLKQSTTFKNTFLLFIYRVKNATFQCYILFCNTLLKCLFSDVIFLLNIVIFTLWRWVPFQKADDL